MSEWKETSWTVQVMKLYVAFVFPVCGVIMLGLGLATLYPGEITQSGFNWVFSISLLLGVTAGVVSATRYLRRKREQTRKEHA